jgi:hypothetical protein
MYKRLRQDYQENLINYRNQLKDEPTIIEDIKKGDIYRYVTQPRDNQNRLTSYDHLVVREVEIHCRFPKTEVSQLGLIDVPGLGYTRVGDEKLIMNTLEKEVDLIIFFRRPDMDRYQWEKQDFQLYDLAAEALSNLPERSFLVLNLRVYGEQNNANGCNLLRNDLGSMKVVDSIIADCSKPEEANKVVDVVLQYLEKHIIEIEENYARSCQKRLLSDIYIPLHEELNAAQFALLSYVRESEQFESKFKQLIGSLSNALIEMLDELQNQRKEKDIHLEKAMKEALTKCEEDSGIPQEDYEIVSRVRDPDYKNSYPVIYEVYARELRNHLSKNFLCLDKGLEEASNQLKLKIAEVLIKQGGLGKLAESLDVEGINFLEVLRDHLATRQNKLELAFTTLINFKMSYGALFLWRIRYELDRVIGEVTSSKTTDSLNSPLVTEGEEKQVLDAAESLSNLPPSMSAITVRDNLKNLHKKAVEKCRLALEKRLTSPSENRYYMAAEFVDRILYEKDIKEAWRHFLSDPDIRAKVWVEFQQIAERKQTEEGWLDKLKNVREVNQKGHLLFLS